MITELEKSLIEVKQTDKKEKEEKAWKIAAKYLSINEIKEYCFVTQSFKCKHNLHSNKHFSQRWPMLGFAGDLFIDNMDVCLLCGNVRAYYGGWHHLGFIDPNKPFPRR